MTVLCRLAPKVTDDCPLPRGLRVMRRRPAGATLPVFAAPRHCAMRELRGAEALRDARMPWSDVLENAILFATVLGIEIVD